MNRFLISLFFSIILLPCIAQERSLISKIQYYSEKAENYLDKENVLSGLYAIDADGIKMFATAKDKIAGKPEFSITWNQLEEYKIQLKTCFTTDAFEIYKKGKYIANIPCLVVGGPLIDYIAIPVKKKLDGYKIAIDAGHIANDQEMGDLEKKHLKFKADTAKGLLDSIEISEGMLTNATAKLLKEKLEADGATVFYTRVNGYNAFGISFEEWLETSYVAAVDSLFAKKRFTTSQKEWLLGDKALKRDKFREVFKDLELEKRANIINNFKPDFTIIIHYNVDETNLEWNKPSSKNFNMTFVGGAFMRNDLSTIQKRFEFLRLLVTDDLEKSIQLSAAVVKQFEKKLNVKTATITDATYLKKGCLRTPEKGVFCRNLQLPRYIHSPLVYGETLYQDNFFECQLLNKEIDKTKNKRVQQVADAYYQGILDYIAITK
jgi:N-acetylmuramoyl-L-alanine amidase